MTDDYDDLCVSCDCRVAGGCVVGGKFYSADAIAEADREVARKHHVEPGMSYNAADFLQRALG